MDAYADAAPDAATRSVASLAAYLGGAGSDDLTRSRALFRWVTRHVDYDLTGFRTGRPGDLSPEGVLRRRTSVCEGYANLTQALGRAMGLEVEEIRGWSRGYGFTIGQRPSGENHAWNAVRVNGQWRFLETTWGAGYLNGEGRYVQDFQEHWFLTPPEQFIYDHFPTDARWQLLERRVSADEFADLPYLRPTFFEARFRLISHQHQVITATDRVTVVLGRELPMRVALELFPASGGRSIEEERSLIQLSDTAAQILVAFPRPGSYLLRLFGGMPDSTGALGWLLDYRVDASRGTDLTFPQYWGGASGRSATLLEPLAGVLRAGLPVRLRVLVPEAERVMVGIGNAATFLARNGDEFSGEITPAAGSVSVSVQFPGSSTFTGMWKFTVR